MNQEKVLKLQALAPAEYLTGDEVIDLSHPSIRRFAGTLRAEHADDVSFARAAFVYARDGVRHSWDVQDPRVTDCGPLSPIPRRKHDARSSGEAALARDRSKKRGGSA